MVGRNVGIYGVIRLIPSSTPDSKWPFPTNVALVAAIDLLLSLTTTFVRYAPTSLASQLLLGTKRSRSSVTTGGASSPGILHYYTQPAAERSWDSPCPFGASLQRS